MPRIRRVVAKQGTTDLEYRSTVQKALAGVEGKRVAAELYRKKQEQATDAYHEMLFAVGDFLHNPSAPAFLEPDASTVDAAFRLGRDQVTVRTEPWGGLSYDYAARSPVSTVFWHKTGRLDRIYRQRANLFIGPPASVAESEIRLVETKTGARAVFPLRFRKLPDAIDTILRASFVRGREYRPAKPGRGVSRQSLYRLVWTERYRPVLSRFAKISGKRLRDQLLNS